jgi:flagellar biosynthesis chaperone FliJ
MEIKIELKKLATQLENSEESLTMNRSNYQELRVKWRN